MTKVRIGIGDQLPTHAAAIPGLFAHHAMQPLVMAAGDHLGQGAEIPANDVDQLHARIRRNTPDDYPPMTQQPGLHHRAIAPLATNSERRFSVEPQNFSGLSLASMAKGSSASMRQASSIASGHCGILLVRTAK